MLEPGIRAGRQRRLGVVSDAEPRRRHHVEAVRPNVPSFGKLRIYLNKAVTTSTAVAWTVLG